MLIGLIGAAFGFYLWNKPQKNMTSAVADLKIEASAIVTAFETNEAEANTKYLDKVVAVSGKVKEIKKEGDKISIFLTSESMMYGVQCNLDPLGKHGKTEFSVGEEVVFKGICTGFLSDVVIERCVLVNN